MYNISKFTSNLSVEDKIKMADALIGKLIENDTTDSVISDAVKCLLNYEPFYPQKGEAYDGLFFSVSYGIRGY